MKYLKMVGLSVLVVVGIVLSPLLIVLSSIVIVFLLIFALGSYIVDIPKQKKAKIELREKSKQFRSKGIYAYFWYDRNSPLADSIEKSFLPKYKKHLIFSYGDGRYGIHLNNELRKLSLLLEELAELEDGGEQSDDVVSAAALYLLKPNENGAFIKWDEIRNEDGSNPVVVNIEASMKRFNEKMSEALGEIRQREIRKKYKGTILAVRNYSAKINEFFVKDLSDPDKLLDFMFEVAGHESDFTPEGLDFVKEYHNFPDLAREARGRGRALPPHGGGKTDADRIKYFLDFVEKIEPMENAAFTSDSVIDEGFSLFYFYFPYDKKAKAERLAKFLYDTDGFKSSMHILDKDVNPDRDWTLEVYKKLTIEHISKIHKIDDGFEKLAERFGGVYDGHEVPIDD